MSGDEDISRTSHNDCSTSTALNTAFAELISYGRAVFEGEIRINNIGLWDFVHFSHCGILSRGILSVGIMSCELLSCGIMSGYQV